MLLKAVYHITAIDSRFVEIFYFILPYISIKRNQNCNIFPKNNKVWPAPRRVKMELMWIVKNRFAVGEIYAGIIKISQNLHTNSSCIFIMPVIIIYLSQCESYRRRKPMNAVCRDIFRAVYEGKWLSIEYRNQQEQVTRYWIGIRNIRPYQRTLEVDGLHLGCCAMEHFRCIYIDSILSSQIIEGSYCPVNPQLIRDISQNPQRYQNLFSHSVNLKILNYLEDCSRMDCTPYRRDFSLVHYLDRETLGNGIYPLSDDQFRLIVRRFQQKAEQRSKSRNGDGYGIGSGEAVPKNSPLRISQLAMNVLSLHTPRGLYVLAYRRLNLDVKERCLRPDEDITICTEFTIDGVKESIRRFLDAGDVGLLEDFEENQEKIKDILAKDCAERMQVDDMPYLIGIGIDVVVDLHREYQAIIEMYEKGEISVPIKAFFGDLLDRPRGGREMPIALLNQQVNLDQLLAIHHGMKYPVAYVQGPPGTGKTNTIIHTIITAFFNERTVLFSSYNNHPIDSVAEKLESIRYKDKPILFPVIRLGNQDKVKEALRRMRRMYEQAREIKVFEKTLDRNKDSRAERAKKLSAILRRYEDQLDLREREETINQMLSYGRKRGNTLEMLPFEADLQGRQLEKIRQRIKADGEIQDRDALALLDNDGEELRKYLYFISAKYIKRIDQPKNHQLKEILFLEDEDAQIQAFEGYIGRSENLKLFLQIFPVVATTCISARRLGEPEIQFDMTIIDEASQCNTAVSLIPIIRGKRLMLVGDPQQLNPVILLDPVINKRLRKKYQVSDEYDYCTNSIYKTYLACDSVSDEVLLRYHYRCNPKIINFNNKKYYHEKLLIRSDDREKVPLQYVDVTDGHTDYKNTAPAEIEEIIRFASMNRDKAVGVITPFVNQKNAIEKRLQEEGLSHVTCGTVHAFQGDEKDVILFSTAITDQTYGSTYDWLKNNKELINVATSRARDRLIVLCSTKNLERLHKERETETGDDLYELIRYVRSRGISYVTPKENQSRALGVKPFSTDTEEAFLEALNHALGNIWLSHTRFTVEKEVAVSQVFQENITGSDLFYSGRFDFVVYQRENQKKYPVLVIELDGKEHCESEIVKARDRKKNAICRAHGMELIRVENSYARRYQHIKAILEAYFKGSTMR